MKSLRLCFLGPLSILCFQIAAQVDDLMKDKNITWIAESYNDFVTDQKVEEKIGKSLGWVTSLKLLNPNEGESFEELALQHYLLEAVKKGDIVTYKDANCRMPYSIDGFVRFDTVTNCFPRDSSEPSFWILANYPNNEDIIFFRAHQILYYDDKRVQFGLRTLAIAPMKRLMNEAGDMLSWQPLFWIKVTDLAKKRKLSDDAITWAKRMTSRDGVTLKVDSVKILKQMNDSSPIAPLFQAFLTKPNIPFYRADSSPLWVKYTFIEKQKLFIRRDTITCVGTEPALIPTIINDDIHPADIAGLQLRQNWYWDDKKKRLEIYLVATAPLKDVKNEAGEFLFKMPLFYRRTDD